MRAALWALGLVTLTAPAWADEPTRDPAAAEQLFERGKKLWADGRFDEACAKFEASHRLDASPSTLVKIARCHERSGALAQALASYQEAAKLNEESSRKGHRDKLAQSITESLAALGPRVPHLTVATDPAGIPGLHVERNGVALPIAALGESLPCDLGAIHLVASAPGFRDAVADLTLEEGATRAVSLHLEPVPPAPPPVEPGPPPPKDLLPPARGPVREAPPAPVELSPLRVAALALGGAGLGGLAGGLALGIATLIKVEASSDDCNDADQCQPRGLRLRDEAGTLQVAAIAMGASGAALLGTGIALFVVAPNPRPASAANPTHAPAFALSAGPTGLGLGGSLLW